jgi:hypothetical protein
MQSISWWLVGVMVAEVSVTTGRLELPFVEFWKTVNVIQKANINNSINNDF